MKIERILVVCSHPDDEVLGCGGFIAKLKEEGKIVKILYLNNGCTFRENHTNQVIESQIHNVHKVLGVKTEPSIYEFETARFETYLQNEFNDTISKEIKIFNLDTVLTHDDNDLHRDHRIVHEAVMVACRYKEVM